MNEVIRLSGLYDSENQSHQAGSIYDIQGICPTITTNGGVQDALN